MTPPRRHSAPARKTSARKTLARKLPIRKAPTRRPLALRLVRLAALVLIWGAIAACLGVLWLARDLPDIGRLEAAPRRPAVTLLAADGSVLLRYGEFQGERLAPHLLPESLVAAVVAIEDRRFFRHPGIDPLGIARAALANLRAGGVVQGGSTFTQQLAKTLFLSPERSLERKVKEALLALKLERDYSKREILAAYLNRVYFGAGSYGVDAAAHTYFDHGARRLDLFESALLAGLLKAPSRLAPTGDPGPAIERAHLVLAAMVETGAITADQAASARMPAALRRPARAPSGANSRWFTAHVMSELDGYLGRIEADLVVATTLEPRAQARAAHHLTRLLDGPGAARDVGQGAVVVLDHDGAILALMGGRDWRRSQFDRALDARRQPGSAFKPLLYLTAFRQGFRPGDPILDAPLEIAGWAPENFTRRYRGEITLATALAESVNTAAVRLMRETGVGPVRRLARLLGIRSELGRDLSLALGTSEVSLGELTAAYASFANGGRPVFPHAIREIRTRAGRVLYRRRGDRAAPVIAPRPLAELTRVLARTVREGTGRAAALAGHPAAGKTGTSQDFRDAWFIGYSAHYVAGVWLGNDDNRPMAEVTGGGLPARLWHDLMADLHSDRPARPLPALTAQAAQAAAAPAPAPGRPSARAAREENGFARLMQRLGLGE